MDKESTEDMEFNKDLFSRAKKNPWVISTIALGAVLLVLVFVKLTGGYLTGASVSEAEIEESALDFFNTELSQVPGEIVSVDKKSGVYEIIFSVGGQEVPLYFTKDAKWIQQGGGLTPITEQEVQQPESQDVVKSDKPIVELFIMTHCPYGTQSEKGMIPVIKALGDSIDAKIRFVHYFMHEPEETETPLQVCIREEQPDKFLDYLACFLEDGDSDRCLTEVGVNKNALSTCVSGKAEEYYAEDSVLSQGYGVKGSPSLVINREIVSSGRSPSAYLATICSAFNNAPEECNEELSNASPSPGFGYAEGQDTGAQC